MTTQEPTDSTDRRQDHGRIPEQQLLDRLRDLADDLGRAPRQQDMRRHGPHSPTTYVNRFGSWETALEKAGLLDEYHPSKYDGLDDRIGDLVDELVRLSTVVGRPPTTDDMNDHGAFSPDSYERLFGSWTEALRTCGYPARYRGGSMLPPAEQRTIYGENWESQRRKALSRDRFRCQDCGVSNTKERQQTGRNLHVHHIVPIRQFDEPELGNHLLNLITLCEGCHQKWESSVRPEIDAEKLASEIRSVRSPSTGGP